MTRTPADPTTSVLDDDPDVAVRRAPFADNPAVGARGQQAQQRILAAALEVFGEVGYHQCRVRRITELAGCSRASFYQYFSSKEDLFRRLAGRVARRLDDSLERLGPVTGDSDGVQALVGYFNRYSEIYDEYQPVFVGFQSAAASDRVMAEGGQRVGGRVRGQIESKIVGSPLTRASFDSAVRTIIESAIYANRMHELIAAGSPPVKLTRKRLNAALADVSHRALFGVIDGVNLRENSRRTRSFGRDDPSVDGVAPAEGAQRADPGPAGLETRAAVLAAAHKAYVERGYYGTRVDDIVRIAGVSHGVFYRYFRNKDELFRLLAGEASRRFAAAYATLGQLDLDSPDARARFRSWVHDYAHTGAEAAAIMRVWADALARDAQLGTDSAAAIRAGCLGIIPVLERRGGGDPEAEAVVMLTLLEAMTAVRPSPRRIEGVASVIERSLLFLDHR